MIKRWIVSGLGAAALLASGVALARVDVGISIGVPPVIIGGPVYAAPAAPVYVAPPPVYVAPAPIYVAPRPVYVAPRPYYYPRPVYYHGGPRYYRERWDGHGHGRGHGHGHGRD
jgi:hypothetical protein